jgi:hypothetical protein
MSEIIPEIIPKRDWFGMFIPAAVWNHPELNCVHKCLYAEIHALKGYEGKCWASNDFLGKSVGIGERQARRMIQKMVDLGIMEIRFGESKKRLLKTLYDRDTTKEEADKNVQPGQKCPATRTKMSGNPDKNVHQSGYIKCVPEMEPPIVPQGGRKSSKASSVSDHTREVASRLWTEFPNMKPVGEKRVSKDLSNLEALLSALPEPEEQELAGMIRSLRSDSFRKGWVASFSKIVEKLTDIRSHLERVSVPGDPARRPTFTERWLADNPQFRTGGGTV